MGDFSKIKIQYKHQKYQVAATKTLVDVYVGQSYLTPSYMIHNLSRMYQQTLTDKPKNGS